MTTVGTDSQKVSSFAVANAKGIGSDDFACYISMGELEIIYVGGVSYIDYGGIKVSSSETTEEEMMTSFSVDSVLAFPISEFTSATVKSEGSATVLTLKGISEELFVEGVLELTEDLFESADEYEAVLACLICDNENYTETYKLDADGKVTEFTLSYTYTEKWDEETEVEFFYEEINTVTDAVEAINLPEDVDSYINADEMQ